MTKILLEQIRKFLVQHNSETLQIDNSVNNDLLLKEAISLLSDVFWQDHPRTGE